MKALATFTDHFPIVQLYLIFVYDLPQVFGSSIELPAARSMSQRFSWADLSEKPEGLSSKAQITKEGPTEKSQKYQAKRGETKAPAHGNRKHFEKEAIRETAIGDSPPRSEGNSSWMWVFDQADETIIDIKEWGCQGPCLEKNGVKMCLWWARVAPMDQSALPCPECGQIAEDHETTCAYANQVLCNWCNMFPCRHDARGKCSRRNFSCGFCHFLTTGHCIGNSHDVSRYRLDCAGP